MSAPIDASGAVVVSVHSRSSCSIAAIRSGATASSENRRDPGQRWPDGTAASPGLRGEYAREFRPRGYLLLEEISEWLREAGFEDIRTVDAPRLAPLLILATKPHS
jgi:hypothetical protein